MIEMLAAAAPVVEKMPFAREIGLIAPIALLLGYALLNLGKLTANHYTYQILNVVGAAALTYTVIRPMSVGVFITELVWTLIGVFGIVKIYLKRRAEKQTAPASGQAA